LIFIIESALKNIYFQKKCSQAGAWEQASVSNDRSKAPALERKSTFIEWTHYLRNNFQGTAL
jgi:hypothetical protein